MSMRTSINLSVSKIETYCEPVAHILKELAHPQRLLILGNLTNGPKTVSELVEACQTSQPQMSHFLMRMKLKGLIKSEKNGKFQHYSIADKRLVELLRTIQKEYCRS